MLEAERAALSKGDSDDGLRRLVASLVVAEGEAEIGTLVDVGCGQGLFAAALGGRARRYIGCDLVRYAGFPEAESARFVPADLNKPPYPIEDEAADAVVAIEVIEHLENPRAFMRELRRMVRRGGRIVVTTPNQLSLLSKLTLVLRDEFNAFQERPGLYPAHITALLEADLRRIAHECGLVDVRVRYSERGRIPFTARAWPSALGRKGRWFSDNVVLSGRRGDS